MASRRDELNAYSFARKRTVASFLKPLPNGSVESAPRPLRTLLPSTILGMLIVVGFGACGIIKPAAPKGWDSPGQKVIVGDKSTTRYVVLKNDEEDEDGKPLKLLHPVLNLASAKLLLDPDKFEVVKVKEEELDNGKVPKGPTIGIPYAPDRLPDADDAERKKTWALCERQSVGPESKTQKAVFVMSEDDNKYKRLVGGPNRLNARQSLYVQDEEGVEYLVDDRGVAHKLDASLGYRGVGQNIPPEKRMVLDDVLRRILFGQAAEPQPVTSDWMDTVIESRLPIFLPPVEGAGAPSQATGVPRKHRVIGKVLEASDDGDTQKYVVLRDELAPVSDFVAELLLEGPVSSLAGGLKEAVGVSQANILPSDVGFLEEVNGKRVPWPTETSTRANTHEKPEGNTVICSVYHGGDREVAGESTGVPELSTWVGKDYPATIADGGRGAYVSPGSGLLYRQVTGKSKYGSLFLVTDTGLRYSVQVNNDSETGAGTADKEQNQAQIRLGYGDISTPPLVPKAWSDLLANGPNLNTEAAKQPQGA